MSNWFGIIAKPTMRLELYFSIIIQWIYNAAENLERAFKKMVKNYLPNIPITIPGSNPFFL